MKNCKFCGIKERLSSDKVDLEDLLSWFASGSKRRREERNGVLSPEFILYKCVHCGRYWESQPLYEKEHMYYSGGPREYVKVTEEYVKEHYPGVLD